MNSDLKNLSNSQALNHFEISGINEGRQFSPFFDFNFYRANNQDLAKLTNSQLLEHFELYGLAQGRKSHPGNNTYQAQNGEIVSPFNPIQSNDLVFRGGKTIPNLNFVNLYFGGSKSWTQTDTQNIDNSLSEAMSDRRLNSIISQYFPGQQVTSNFLGSGIIEGSLPSTTVTQQYIETLLTGVGNRGGFNGFDLSSTVFDLMLPQGITLTSGNDSSQTGLGGFHGSVNFQGSDGKQKTAYYAIGVYSENYSYLGFNYNNGIPVFNQPWKNVVATAYHELNEARTDPDGSNRNLIGWDSDKGDEVGDYPLTVASQYSVNDSVFKEVPLLDGKGTVPIQLLYSNAVHGPEDPTKILST